MAHTTPQRSRFGTTGWIIGGLVLVLLLLFVVFGYGQRTSATDPETPAPATEPVAPAGDTAPATIQ